MRRSLLLAAALVCVGTAARADVVTLRFSGTVDLSSFGASAASEFDGRVSWDPTRDPDSIGAYWARYLLDGSPSAVEATFAIDGVEYQDRIEPFSRFEITTEDMFLQLWFAPVIDLDASTAPDLLVFSMDLWTETPPVFLEFNSLPADLSFLARLERRRVWFAGEGGGASTDDFKVSAPGQLTLLPMGIAAVAFRLRRRVFLRRGRPSAGQCPRISS